MKIKKLSIKIQECKFYIMPDEDFRSATIYRHGSKAYFYLNEILNTAPNSRGWIKNGVTDLEYRRYLKEYRQALGRYIRLLAFI